MNKFKLTKNTKEVFGVTLFQIQALKDFFSVSKGELGGWVEKESNLSQENNCWISGNARIYGNVRIFGNARIFDNARISGDARIFDNTRISGDACIFGDAYISGDARISGNARIFGDACIFGDARISGDARILWFSKVGSEYGTLTAFMDKDKNILVNRGCFNGTMKEFEKANNKNSSEKVKTEYELLIKFIKLRFKGE